MLQLVMMNKTHIRENNKKENKLIKQLKLPLKRLKLLLIQLKRSHHKNLKRIDSYYQGILILYFKNSPINNMDALNVLQILSR